MSSIVEILLGGSFAWTIILPLTLIFTIGLIYIYYKLDRYDPEPIKQVVLAYFIGMLVPLISVPPNYFMQYLILEIYSDRSLFIEVVIFAPIIEELAKGVFLLFVLRIFETDGPFDSFLYGVCVGAGFATIENLIYAFSVLMELGIISAITVSFLRGGFAIIGHPIYTGIFGFGIGCQKIGIHQFSYKNIQKSIILHAGWNLTFALPLYIGFNVFVFLILLLTIILITAYLLKQIIELSLKIEDQLYELGYFDNKGKIKAHLIGI